MTKSALPVITVLEVSKNQRQFPKSSGRGFKYDVRDYDKSPRLYFSHKDESIIENLGNRTVRPVTLYKGVLPEILEKLGLPKDTKYRWSRYAGCTMCPCSPGFILEASGKFDAWVTVDGKPREDSPEADAVFAGRVAAVMNDGTLGPLLVKPAYERTVADLYDRNGELA